MSQRQFDLYLQVEQANGFLFKWPTMWTWNLDAVAAQNGQYGHLNTFLVVMAGVDTFSLAALAARSALLVTSP